ncbi:amidase family protein [Moniliophthora roreri MCA 2997]|uniref:Amidase family protein n=1 Tax=Moniliophthora roreri (strain MCA 2997) TaxID=1381753 RepID=V2X4M6_MONRO|nr:amidase family protein [Moniliophthora roreri MCA 2997]
MHSALAPVLAILFPILPIYSLKIVQSNSLGDIATIADTLYFIQSNINAASFAAAVEPGPAQYGLITVVPIPFAETTITGDLLSKIIADYATIDDVWSKMFLQGLILSPDPTVTDEIELDESLFGWMRDRDIEVLFVDGPRLPRNWTPRSGPFQVVSIPKKLSPGPYAYSVDAGTLALHNVYRLCPDEYDSFMLGCIPDTSVDSGLTWIPTNFTLPSVLSSSNFEDSSFEDNVQYQYIPIPSRLPYFSGFGSNSPFPISLLSGRRVAIKDIFDMQGLPTSAGSRAYLEMTGGPAVETSLALEKLFALGVIPVGKTHTSQFAHGASPWEFQDFSYPWNPRGDGLLTAVASSSGSACAIAGYEWLDLAVGSDTRGSVRKPASLVGAYGIRPSFGSMDLRGVVPLSEHMDTVGIFARDPNLFVEVAKQWYNDSPISLGNEFIRFPSRVLVPVDHFPVKSPEAQSINDVFMDFLVKELNFTRVSINITKKLSPQFPQGQFRAFQTLSNQLSEYHSWTKVGKPLTSWYRSRFGRDPDLDPMPRIMFARALNHSAEDYDGATSYKERFTAYINDELFKFNAISCSDSILIYDAGTGGLPSYRVEDFNALEGASEVTLVRPGKDAKLSENLHYLASMASLVDVTVPLGQTSYFSPVTRQWEVIPVTIQLVTRRGCDSIILDLVRLLAEKGFLKAVSTGPEPFVH